MKHAWILASALLAGLIVLPRYVDSCSPAPPELRFTTYHNMLPAELAGGRIGVLRPHFRRRSLLLAYRGLSGLPVRTDELHLAGVPLYYFGSDAWLKARLLLTGVPGVKTIDVTKKVPGQDYQFYTNCLDDAFATATATLRNRVAQWGAASPQTAEWLRGQDQVFQNCAAGPAIPQPLTGGDKLLAADREYQIAAAEFYAEQYDRAAADFDRISSDAGSPWHDTARYVAARVRIRQGTMGKDAAKLRDAGARLEAIVKDPAAANWHAPAEALLGFVRAQAEPEKQLAALGRQLMQPGPPEQLERALTDYTSIWDRVETDKAFVPPPDSDVAQWIAAFQADRPAIDTWRAKKTLPWLIAALQKAQTSDPELIAAAHDVKPDSPAWDSVTYYGILAEIRAGELDAARAWAGDALAAKPALATANLLRSERLRLARDWTEFLQFAPRRPVTDMSDEDESDEPIDDATLKQHPVALDADSVTALNHRVPLSLWLDAAQNSLMPANLQSGIAQAGWVRAVVLGNNDVARKLAERLGKLKPVLAVEMRTWLAEKDPAAAQFTAVFLMLRAPGLEPMVRYGSGRETPVTKSDIFRDNWWLLEPMGRVYDSEHNHQALFDLYPDGQFGPTGFLPEGRASAAAKEWQDLNQRAQNSVNYLCTQTLEWARAHPEDPRVPQALHLDVEATHYGPSDKSSSYSRQAFDLLHRRYPNSEWTKKTKYWY
ncbi:MAG: hypothetical protein P4L56_13755 [Candidatus Sulfopaludibacter sp.]|nr:hypothetical protein [Candidatus Sulfopaludibacter sp.]